MKSVLIKNSVKLFIAADSSKLFSGGEPFFTLILPARVCAKETQAEDPAERLPTRRSSIAPVRSRGAVRMRRIQSQAAAPTGSQGSSGASDDIDVDASVDVREPGSTVLVTSTDEHGEVPAELRRQLLALQSEEDFETIMSAACSTIVVVDRRGSPVPLTLS
jgi:hypothetical protein